MSTGGLYLRFVSIDPPFGHSGVSVGTGQMDTVLRARHFVKSDGDGGSPLSGGRHEPRFARIDNRHKLGTIVVLDLNITGVMSVR